MKTINVEIDKRTMESSSPTVSNSTLIWQFLKKQGPRTSVQLEKHLNLPYSSCRTAIRILFKKDLIKTHTCTECRSTTLIEVKE